MMVLLLRFTTSSYTSHIWSPAVYSIFIVCFLPIRLFNLKDAAFVMVRLIRGLDGKRKALRELTAII
jgi:hypothetical protein